MIDVILSLSAAAGSQCYAVHRCAAGYDVISTKTLEKMTNYAVKLSICVLVDIDLIEAINYLGHKFIQA